MPMLGFGTAGIWNEQAPKIICDAIAAGFSLIDTAAYYKNERGIGRALQSIPLNQPIFVTTKVWNCDQGYDKTIRAFEASLRRLGREIVDLYLIHWPLPQQDKYTDTWRSLIRLRSEGRIRSIGVSNFTIPQLRRLIDDTGVTPAVNQVELHPRFQQRELRAFHREMGIVTQAWSPLGGGTALMDPVVRAIASKHGCTQAQVILSWHLSLGISPIPKAASSEHLNDNAAAIKLALDAEDLGMIFELDEPNGRLGPDPETLDLESSFVRWSRRISSLTKDPAHLGKRLRRFLSR